MVEKLDDKFEVRSNGEVVERDYRDNLILTLQSPITAFRNLDVASAVSVVGGYLMGDTNLMLAGMALYQANTGNRA